MFGKLGEDPRFRLRDGYGQRQRLYKSILPNRLMMDYESQKRQENAHDLKILELSYKYKIKYEDTNGDLSVIPLSTQGEKKTVVTNNLDDKNNIEAYPYITNSYPAIDIYQFKPQPFHFRDLILCANPENETSMQTPYLSPYCFEDLRISPYSALQPGEETYHIIVPPSYQKKKMKSFALPNGLMCMIIQDDDAKCAGKKDIYRNGHRLITLLYISVFRF